MCPHFLCLAYLPRRELCHKTGLTNINEEIKIHLRFAFAASTGEENAPAAKIFGLFSAKSEIVAMLSAKPKDCSESDRLPVGMGVLWNALVGDLGSSSPKSWLIESIDVVDSSACTSLSKWIAISHSQFFRAPTMHFSVIQVAEAYYLPLRE